MLKKILLFFLIACTSAFADVRWFDISNIGASGSIPDAEPVISLNNNNQAVAVWVTLIDGRYAIKSKTWTPSSGWQQETRLSSTSEDAVSPQVIINNSGQVLAVYQSFAPGTSDPGQYKYITMNFGSNWSFPNSPVIPNTLSGTGFAYSLAMNNSGQAILVFQDDILTQVRASTFIFGGSWNTTLLSSDGLSGTTLSLNDIGQAVAVWSKSAGTLELFTYAFNDPSPSWTSQTSPSGGLGIGDWSIAINNSGQIIMSWFVGVLGQPLRAATSTFSSTLAFSPTEIVDTTSSNFFSEVAINDSGQILIASVEDDLNLRTATKTFSETTWDTSQNPHFTATNDLSITPPLLNEFGQAIILFSDVNAQNNGDVQAINSTFGETWSSPFILSTPSQLVTGMEVALNDVGLIISIWSNATNLSVEGRVGTFPPLPPGGGNNGNVKGEQNRNRFLTQTEYYNNVTWDSSPSPFITYLISANSKQVGGSSDTKFSHRGQKKKRPVTYSINAINALGQVSTSVSGVVP